MGFLEVNVRCHILKRVNKRKGVLGNAAALQHSFQLVLLSQATDNYQLLPGIYLHAELTMTTVSVSIPAAV